MLTMVFNNYFGLREAPFNAAPNPDFFYSNPHFQEPFANLRHGIEAKKGLMVITGEAGTGKTILLRKLMNGLGSSTSFVFIFCPYLDFTDLLRIIVHDLGLPSHQKDKSAMIAELTAYLNAQIEGGRIISLLIDEAQNLSAELLEGISILSNLENNRQKLIQIALAGQPGLDTKLNEPQLHALKQRVAIHCQLAPLTKNDVGLYIDYRLRTAGYGGNGLFDSNALERIAAYSQGLPRVINVICDKALCAAYAASKQIVTPDVIHEVARDLDLTDKTEIATEAPPIHFDVAWEDNLSPAAQGDADTPEWAFNAEVDELWERSLVGFKEPRCNVRQAVKSFLSRAVRVGVGTLSVLFILMAGRGAIYSEQSKNHLSDLALVLDNLIETGVERLPRSDHFAESPRMAKARTEAAAVELPVPVDTLLSEKSDNGESPDVVSTVIKVKRAEARASVPLEEKRSLRTKLSIASQQGSKSQAASQVSLAVRDNMEMKLYNAISNRAISGVVVSFIDGTVYLDGGVATERQKTAALEAVRRVPGVKYVRDRVRVSY